MIFITNENIFLSNVLLMFFSILKGKITLWLPKFICIKYSDKIGIFTYTSLYRFLYSGWLHLQYFLRYSFSLSPGVTHDKEGFWYIYFVSQSLLAFEWFTKNLLHCQNSQSSSSLIMVHMISKLFLYLKKYMNRIHVGKKWISGVCWYRLVNYNCWWINHLFYDSASLFAQVLPMIRQDFCILYYIIYFVSQSLLVFLKQFAKNCLLKKNLFYRRKAQSSSSCMTVHLTIGGILLLESIIELTVRVSILTTLKKVQFNDNL